MSAPAGVMGNQWRCPECDSTLRHTVNITLTPMEMLTYDMELDWSESSQPSEPSDDGSIVTMVEIGTQTNYYDSDEAVERSNGRQTSTKGDENPGDKSDNDPRLGDK